MVALLTALGGRDALVRDAELRAGQALQTMTNDEDLSLREAAAVPVEVMGVPVSGGSSAPTSPSVCGRRGGEAGTTAERAGGVLYYRHLRLVAAGEVRLEAIDINRLHE